MMTQEEKMRLQVAAKARPVERQFWMNRLGGGLIPARFPPDLPGSETGGAGSELREIGFEMPPEVLSSIITLSGGSDTAIHIVLLALVALTLKQYAFDSDILLSTPIFKQENPEGLINRILPIKVPMTGDMTVKDLLVRLRQAVVDAMKHRNYPVEILAGEIEAPPGNGSFPLFDVGVVLANIQDYTYFDGLTLNIMFRFYREHQLLRCTLNYRYPMYREATVTRITRILQEIARRVFTRMDTRIGQLDALPAEERKQVLMAFNATDCRFPDSQTLPAAVQHRAGTSGPMIALRCGEEQLTYDVIAAWSNQWARLLEKQGVTAETVVAIMTERSPQTVIALLAILKAGAAYLPVDTGTPARRVRQMLEDAAVSHVMVDRRALESVPFSRLLDIDGPAAAHVHFTGQREHIEDFNRIGFPDRSAIQFKNYRDKIGMASVTNCISLQATRGCPYRCLFCHKIWSKNYVFRQAGNILEEIEYYYKAGVKNFAFIDDCFNLARENSRKLFAGILRKKMALQLFFPNGLRGDLLSEDYLDLMVEAGTRGINLSLESASPGMQRLLRKDLDLDRFREVVDYIAAAHPGVILELATLHGIVGETEADALMTLDFIKKTRWIHFPYVHILKIFPNTEMERFALEQGIRREDILASRDQAFHQLPATLPFPESFTRTYQASVLNEYFLNKERLKQVLPVQMEILSPLALVQKYDAYLPARIRSIDDLLEFAQLEDLQVPDRMRRETEPGETASLFDFTGEPAAAEAGKKRVLLLDLSQHFSRVKMLYAVAEQPLGLIYLLTDLHRRFGDRVQGRIAKSGNDFDSYEGLKQILEDFQPDLIGIRTLTFFREFFHETVSLIRQWGFTGPLITGGPYASSDFMTILNHRHVDLAVIGEGEAIFAELIREMLKHGFRLPPQHVLEQIKGIAYPVHGRAKATRSVMVMENLEETALGESPGAVHPVGPASAPAYVMYTSGSTGTPKGVMVEHRQVNNCIHWMQKEFALVPGDFVVQRTHLMFDPSVYEIFWPLSTGARLNLLPEHKSRDPECLIEVMACPGEATLMYCPASLLKAVCLVLKDKKNPMRLRMKWLLIGAESIRRETVKDFYGFFEGKIVNTYGPTEGTINNTYCYLDRSDSRAEVPIGKPVANNRLYIVIGDMIPAPVGAEGEICIAGASVARGYINHPELTRESFIDYHFLTPKAKSQEPVSDSTSTNPLYRCPTPLRAKSQELRAKLYKTGDLGRWLPDGNIAIKGRKDDQVKIRGYRLEPGEIRTALLSHEGVADGVVVVRGGEKKEKEQRPCKSCGITGSYPGISIADTGTCSGCEEFFQYKPVLNGYFSTLVQLEEELKTRRGNAPYHCLLVYNGGKGATYALYRLLELGLQVMTLTYDNGFFSRRHQERIKRITQALEVPHVYVTHKNSRQILKKSLETVSTVCRGCYDVSHALAGEYALKNRIPAVVGATLSRGQIIENKLLMFLRRGIREVRILDEEIKGLLREIPRIDKEIFDLIDIDAVQTAAVHDRVSFYDFFRYCDVTNEGMLAFLEAKDACPEITGNISLYSTNCPVKGVGDFCHIRHKSYHYYGSATHWEVRLGHLSRAQAQEDLKIRLNERTYDRFIAEIGYEEKTASAWDERELCAYIVPAAGEMQPTPDSLRAFLQKRLPHYMVPSQFVILRQMPLTASGKIDYRALPEPEVLSGREYVAPGNETEEKLVSLWQEVLGARRPGITDNFFDLGGHSLKMIQLASRVHQELAVKISLSDMFDRPTIAKLAQYIRRAGKEDGMIIRPARKKEWYDLSSAQKRIYILCMMNPGSTVYNNPNAIVLREQPDREKLERCFRQLIERHESIRTSFTLRQGKPVQIIHEQVEFRLDSLRLVEDNIQLAIHRFIAPFDLTKPPLLKACLIKVPGGQCFLLTDMHHIITDGVSMLVVIQELETLMAGKALPGIKLQYKDFSEWQNDFIQSGEMEKQKRYWLERFSGPLPVLKLPLDKEAPQHQVFDGAVHYFTVPEELTAGLKRLSRDTASTLYIVLLAAYTVLLRKYSGQEDIIVGSAITGRRHADLQRVVGMFVNMLAMRNFPAGEKTFEEFLGEVKENALNAFENQDFQFEDLVIRLGLPGDASKNPVFDTVFNLHNYDFGTPRPVGTGTGELNSTPYDTGHVQSQFTLLMEGLEVGAKIEFMITYLTALFSRETIEKIGKRYLEILEQVTGNPEIKLKDINLEHSLLEAPSAISIREEGDFAF